MNTSHLRSETDAKYLEDAAALTCLLPEFHLMGLSIGNEVTT